jgi:predicted nucleic acid-binding protein
VIHLDTNLLIRATHADTRVVGALEHWLEKGETLAVSSIAWFEFICGPLGADAANLVARIATGGIAAFGAMQAERAAELFTTTGRKRASRWDCMIAAAAIEADASLATLSRANFQPFAAAGLRLSAL